MCLLHVVPFHQNHIYTTASMIAPADVAGDGHRKQEVIELRMTLILVNPAASLSEEDALGGKLRPMLVAKEPACLSEMENCACNGGPEFNSWSWEDLEKRIGYPTPMV